MLYPLNHQVCRSERVIIQKDQVYNANEWRERKEKEKWKGMESKGWRPIIEKGVGIELHIKWKLFLEVINNVQEIFFNVMFRVKENNIFVM